TNVLHNFPTLQVLEKKEEIFTERVAESVEEAREYVRVGNKKGSNV
ncbi:hypothetical protein LINPERPRIM_LOCUS39301, partial [Linum perenne]